RVRNLGIADVVVVKPLDPVLRDDLAEDRERVLARGAVRRIDVDPLPVGAAGRIEVRDREFTSSATRCAGRGPEQPFRVRVDEVLGRTGELAGGARPNEKDVAPGVDAHADRRARADEMGERVEARGEAFGAGLERAFVVRVAAPAHLPDEVVYPARSGVGHELVDGARGRDPVADDPERALHQPAASASRAASMASGPDVTGMVHPPAASHRRAPVCAIPSAASRRGIARSPAVNASSEKPPIAPRSGTAAMNAARLGLPPRRGFQDTAETGYRARSMT